jgi:hypothetical protein
VTEDTSESEEVLDFPGYDYGEALGEDMAGRRVLGTKPFDFGIGTVKISYSGVKVLIDIHVKKIAGFDPRDFPQMQLYPGHLKDSAEISYTIFHKKVRVSLEAVPHRQVVLVKLTGDSPIKQHLPKQTIVVPYLDGPYPFPNVKGLSHPRSYTHDDVQEILNKGTWHDQLAGAPALETTDDGAHDLITMLGGDNWLRETRAALAAAQGEATGAPGLTINDNLVAFGARVTGKTVLSFDKGVGFYITTTGVGLFLMGQASIGVAIEISAELMECYYWGPDQTPGSALEAFKSVNGFVSVSAGAEVEGSLDFVFTGSPHLRLTGLNFGVGLGAGYSIAGGVQKVAGGTFIRP